MNIKHSDGMVTFVMRAGKDFVRSQMPLANAVAITTAGKEVGETDKRGFGTELCVDDTYFFPIDTPKPVRKCKKKETTE